MMLLRFSTNGPGFPARLVDALMDGDVVFLCGAGISAPQLPGFSSLVQQCFVRLKMDMSVAETESFKHGRFEEALGSLSRRIVDPSRMTKTVVDLLAPSKCADLTQHRTILRLSRDRHNKPLIVTTNFDTMLEHALSGSESVGQIRTMSLAGQDLPPPGSPSFSGIIHLHGRVPDADLGLDSTPFVLTSADYGDAYMRSGWASRFLFDLCRCKTIVLIGYSAGDAPVRYFLNVLEADRQRFPDLRSVYALDGVDKHGKPDVAWAALAVEPITYEKVKLESGGNSHENLWRDLACLADLVERPRSSRKSMAENILSQKFEDVVEQDLVQIRWLFKGHRDLFGIAIEKIIDTTWLDFFHEENLWNSQDGAWVIAAWIARDLESVDRFSQALKWVEKLGEPFVEKMGQRTQQAASLPDIWIRAWRLLSLVKNPDSRWEHGTYLLKERLQSSIVLYSDIQKAVDRLAPLFSLGNSIDVKSGRTIIDNPKKLHELAWPRLAINRDGGEEELLETLVALPRVESILNIANYKLQEIISLSLDMDGINDDYDSVNYYVPSIEPHAQNAYQDGPIYIVQLLVRLIPVALEKNASLVRIIVDSWRELPGLLGVRLWLHAMRSAVLFTDEQAAAALKSLPSNIFWAIRREIAILLRDRTIHATSITVLDIEKRILTEGKSYYEKYFLEEGQIDWREQARDQAVWLNLNMLQKAGRLSELGIWELNAIKIRSKHLDREVEDSDFFGSYSSGLRFVAGDAKPIAEAPEDSRLEIAHRERLSHDLNKQRGWSAYCQVDPEGAFQTLRGAPLENVNASLWNDLVLSLSFYDDEKLILRANLIAQIFDALKSCGDSFLSVVVVSLSGLYSSAPRLIYPTISGWWPRLFAASVAQDLELLTATKGLYSAAINSPGGRLTQALLLDIQDRRTRAELIESRLVDALHQAALGGGRQGSFARAALVYAAGFVATIEGSDVVRLLNEALEKDTIEGKALRFVLVADARQSVTASHAFSAHILRGVEEFDGSGRQANAAASKVIAPLISVIRGEYEMKDWGITADNTATVLRNSHPSLRAGAVDLLSQWITQIDGSRASTWRNVIAPFLYKTWPSERALNDKVISEQFAKLAVESEEAFPEALEAVMPYLLPAESGGVVHLIKRSHVPEKFPLETLSLLWRLFSESTAVMFEVPFILERLTKALPAIGIDRRFQWLDRHATRYE